MKFKKLKCCIKNSLFIIFIAYTVFLLGFGTDTDFSSCHTHWDSKNAICWFSVKNWWFVVISTGTEYNELDIIFANSCRHVQVQMFYPFEYRVQIWKKRWAIIFRLELRQKRTKSPISFWLNGITFDCSVMKTILWSARCSQTFVNDHLAPAFSDHNFGIPIHVLTLNNGRLSTTATNLGSRG